MIVPHLDKTQNVHRETNKIKPGIISRSYIAQLERLKDSVEPLSSIIYDSNLPGVSFGFIYGILFLV